MNIAYLSASTIPSRAANSVHVMKMCDAFAGQGHCIELFAKRSSLSDDAFHFYGIDNSFQIHFTPKNKSLKQKLFAKYHLANKIKAACPDLIYARNAKTMTNVVSSGIPFVLEAHLMPREHSEMASLIEQKNFRRLVVISRALQEDFLNRFPSLDESNIVVAYDAASPPEALGEAIAASGRLRVGYLGHLYDGKGMEIIAELAQRCSWADFHVVGGLDEDIASWQARLATIPNLTLHGFVPHHETPAYVASFDVAMAPYQRQVGVHGGGGVNAARWMSPLKIFEYMAHGRAMIVSELPVLAEVLEHEVNALLVPPDDVDAWARAVDRLGAEPDLRGRLGERARQDFERRHTWQGRARAVLEGL